MRRAVAALLLLGAAGCASVDRTAGGEWRAYGGDAGGTRYSPLTEITAATVGRLQPAWTYHTGDTKFETKLELNSAFEATPLFVDGLLYVSTPFNKVIALDGATGAERWTFDPRIDRAAHYSEATSRGVSYWSDEHAERSALCGRKIIAATLDARLFAVDAGSGQLCRDFGTEGFVDLRQGVDQLRERGEYVVTSPPAIIGDLIVVGSAVGDNGPVRSERGVVRAFDARSGALRWSFDPVARGVARPPDSWTEDGLRTGGANAWSTMSVDAARGLVFVPTSSPSPDYYGGERIGRNDYANSVVALRAATGAVAWHFQVVHHDLWDYDVATQPVLLTVRRDARNIDAVAVGTKMGHLFVLDRDSGTPLFPVEERAVPPSDVAGERAWPTQPFPLKPRPLVPHGLKAADAWGLTDADREWCRKRLADARSEGIFTPPSLGGTISLPGNVGGMHWGPMSFDPSRRLLVANTNNVAAFVKLIARDSLRDARRTAGENRIGGEFGEMAETPYGMYREILLAPGAMLPCVAPPWGTLAAVDIDSGDVRWQVPLGVMPQLATHPDGPSYGSANLGGSMTTGGLVFIAATMDPVLRAFDITTGREVWRAELPAGGQASPMTYAAGGRQFVVIAAGGHGRLHTKRGDAVVAYALP